MNSLIRIPAGKLISAENIWSLQSCDVIKVKKGFQYQAQKWPPLKCIAANLTEAEAGGPLLFSVSDVLFI